MEGAFCPVGLPVGACFCTCRLRISERNSSNEAGVDHNQLRAPSEMRSEFGAGNIEGQEIKFRGREQQHL